MKEIIKIFVLLIISFASNAQNEAAENNAGQLSNNENDSVSFYKYFDLSFDYQEKNFDSSLYYARKCKAIAQSANKKLNEALAMDLEGYSLYQSNKFLISYRVYMDAFSIAENTKNNNKAWLRIDKNRKVNPHYFERYLILNLHHDFAHLMLTTGNTKKSLSHYYEAKKIAESINDTEQIAFVTMNLGRVFFDLNKLDSSFYMSEEAIRLFNRVGQKKYISSCYIRKGLIYIAMGNKKSAKQNFHNAIQLAIESNNYRDLGRSYSELVSVFIEEKNKDSSLFYAGKNLTLFQTTKTLNRRAYYDLYKSYKLYNNTDSVNKYLELAFNNNDSIYRKQIVDFSEIQHQLLNEQTRIQELEKEQIEYRSSLRTYIMLAGIVAFALVTFLVIRNNRQKQKAKAKIEAAYFELKETQSQLIQREKMASLGELTAGIAHEIQNPLNFVNNFSEVSKELLDEMKEAMEKGDTEDAKEIMTNVIQNLEKINHHGKRADGIVKGMLQHSRTGSGQKEPTDINALCDEYLRLSYHGLRAKDKSFNAKFETSFDETIGKINVMPQDMGRVILNLINNAFYAVTEKKKLNPEGYDPSVTVSTKKTEGRIEVSVKDNGNGIPQKVLDKIFQPFFTTKPTGQGTGLGLSLSYDIVKAHGGEIRVETKAGEGTMFIISLSDNS